MSAMKRQQGFAVAGLLVLALAFTLAPTASATDAPRKITAWSWYGAPGCDFLAGEVFFTNHSRVFHYRIAVNASFSVPDLACGTAGCPIPKADCMCGEMGGILILAPEGQDSVGCVLPRCQDVCEIHCDNTNPTCSPASHCTTSETPASFTYLQWSRDGSTWHEFEDLYVDEVFAHEESAFCP